MEKKKTQYFFIITGLSIASDNKPQYSTFSGKILTENKGQALYIEVYVSLKEKYFFNMDPAILFYHVEKIPKQEEQ